MGSTPHRHGAAGSCWASAARLASQHAHPSPEDLTAAIKARDPLAVAALRSALAAIENAEATEVVSAPRPAAGREYVAASAAGLGAAEVERRLLSDGDVHALVQAQVDDRSVAAEEYEKLGREDLAGKLRAEADVLRQYLHPPRGATA